MCRHIRKKVDYFTTKLEYHACSGTYLPVLETNRLLDTNPKMYQPFSCAILSKYYFLQVFAKMLLQ